MPGRNKPNILLKTVDSSNSNLEIQITTTGKYFIIVYDSKPINIITVNNSPYNWQVLRRYHKTGYANRGHAQRRAEQLNKLFGTNKFTVKEL